MQVPEHLVSLYVATCGQNGPNLGSDEKEIIFLVFTVLDPMNAQVIGEKKILVRPEGNFNNNKDVVIAGNSDASNNLNATNNEKNNFEINSAVNERIHNLKPVNNNAISPNGNALVRQNSNEVAVMPPAQEIGVTLSEAIEESDLFLRSLLNNNEKAIENLQIITDGQLPLRQSLHREACVKDIQLPSYYGRFSDLRKEYARYKSGDLSRALVPVKDIKKIMQLPTSPLPPQSITEILSDLSLPSCEETDFFLRESHDMVSVVKFLLKAGHKFYANEIVNLVLQPGICSIDEEIDGNCIVRARGLPWQSSDQDIAKFFRGLNVAKGGVALCLSPLGRRNGEALIRFISLEHRDMALKRHKHHIGSRYIEVYRATGEDFLAVAGGASNEAKAFLSKGAQVIIRMRGLPYDCTAKQVLDFFTAGDSPCNVLDGAEGVLFVKKPDGRATGDAFVLFANEADAPKALSRHRESIGQRYIELFRSTTAEVQQVLNRSLDPKTYEVNQQPPLIAQLPTMPLSLLPQHFITSGTAKNCIRLRGLPYEALVEHILHFLDDFAKHIIYQGVHMVINAQGQPSGEAFIQMDTEESARLCAQRKHNQFMVFGKKYRYIEVFQCSGDDMNLVLNGGLQSVGTATALHPHAHHHAGAKQPPLLSPGASLIGAPFIPHFAHFGQPPQRAFIAAAPTAQRVTQARAHPSAHHPAIAAGATFYQQSVYPVYWPYPSPPVSPTTYFSPPAHSPVSNGHSTHHVFPLDFISANYGIAPTSPLGTLPSPTGGIVITNKTPLLQLAPPTPKQFSAAVAAAAATTTTIQALTPNPAAAAAAANHIRHNGLTAVPLATKTNTLQTLSSSKSKSTAIKGEAKPVVVKPLPSPSPAAAAVPTPPSLALLAINTCDQLIKTTSQTATTTTTTAPNSIENAPNAQIVPQNQCVELFIS